MSLLGLRFRTVANRLQLLDYHHPDLAFELVSALVSTQLTNRWEQAIARGQDPEDPYTVWELLYVETNTSLATSCLAPLGASCVKTFITQIHPSSRK